MRSLLILSALISMAIGQQMGNSSERIVGGQIANRGEFPWIVSLQINGEHRCGGSIIGPSWIVTAAHCIIAPADQFMAVAGEYYLGEYEGREQVRSVSTIIRHRDFGGSTFANDIALIRVSSPFMFGPYVRPIRLAILPVDFYGLLNFGNLVAAGWGDTTFRGNASKILRKVTVPLVSTASCQANYARVDPTFQIRPGMFCSGSLGRHICQGDSGGPIMSGNNLVGISSFVVDCGNIAGIPAGFASIPYYINWINMATQYRYWL